MPEITEAPDLPPPPKRKSFFSFKKMLVTLGVLIALFALVWGGLFAYFDYTNQFPIKSVKVIGLYQFVNETQIEHSLNPFLRGKGLFSFSETDATAALAEIPGVASVSIWRIPPSKLKVIIRERSAVARFGDNQLFSSDGVPFNTSNPTAAVAQLPLLKGNPAYAKQMLEMLQSVQPIFASINTSVSGLGLADNGDWSIQINNQTWIMLGKNDLPDRVQNFIMAYPALIKAAPPGASLSYVDLRYAHGFSAGWAGATPSAS